MNVAGLKSHLHQEIENINNQEQLEEILAMLNVPKVRFEKMSLEEYVEAIDEAKKQIRQGQFTSVEDLEKESESW